MEHPPRQIVTEDGPEPTPVWARRYLERGWSPIPVPRRSKAPTISDWQNLHLARSPTDLGKYFPDGSDSNVGVLLGEPSNGLIDIDLDTREARMLAGAILPPTDAIFGRKSSHASHWLYQVEGPVPKTKKFLAGHRMTLVELRSTGTQSIFPPSTHPSEEPITWSNDGEPALIEGRELLARVGELAAATLLTRFWKEAAPSNRPDSKEGGGRHSLALHLAGGLLTSGWSEDQVERWIALIARTAGDDEVEDRVQAVRTTARCIRDHKPYSGWRRLEELAEVSTVRLIIDWLGLERKTITEPAVELVDELHATDVGNARRLIKRHGDGLRYDGTSGRWLVWDGRRWQVDEKLQVVERAKDTVQAMHEQAIALPMGTKQRDELQKHAKQSETGQRIREMINLARSEPGIPVIAEEMDANRWLLAVENGTIDLRTGELFPSRREDLITRMVRAPYLANAACPTWEQFLWFAMGGADAKSEEEEERARGMVRYIQQLVGYTLTGSTREQLMVFCYGPPDTGKTTIVETLSALLDEFAKKLPVDLLLTGMRDAGEYDMADLKGARYAYAVEPGEERKLNVARVKELTGDDAIRGRHPYGKPFSFRPTHTIWLATNHQPQIRGGDEAIWTRIRVVPFLRQVPEEEQDKELLDKLIGELPGILRWGVEGCLDWLTNGLQTPLPVKRAVKTYREENDVLAAWAADWLVASEDEKSWISTEDLYQSFRNWAESHGERSSLNLTYPGFGRRFTPYAESEGFRKKSSNTGYAGWAGVRIRQVRLVSKEPPAGFAREDREAR